MKIDKMIADRIGELATVIAERVEWFGAQLESMPTASAILDSAPVLSEFEFEQASKVYDGQQWPSDILAIRSTATPPRPCLVVNRLPELVSAAIDKQRESGLPALSEGKLETLKAVIAAQNKDAQLLYNYILSSFVEMLQEASATK